MYYITTQREVLSYIFKPKVLRPVPYIVNGPGCEAFQEHDHC